VTRPLLFGEIVLGLAFAVPATMRAADELFVPGAKRKVEAEGGVGGEGPKRFFAGLPGEWEHG